MPLRIPGYLAYPECEVSGSRSCRIEIAFSGISAWARDGSDNSQYKNTEAPSYIWALQALPGPPWALSSFDEAYIIAYIFYYVNRCPVLEDGYRLQHGPEIPII